jgi:hypothetical protein
LRFFAKHIDVDFPIEYFSEKYNLDISKLGSADDKRRARQIGMKVTSEELINYISGMLPMVINVVGDDVEILKTRVQILRSFGYDVGVLFINTDLKTAIDRLFKRTYGKNGKKQRYIPPEYLKDSFKELLKNAEVYQKMVSSNVEKADGILDFYDEINNGSNLDNDVTDRVQKIASKFFNMPLKNAVGIKVMKELKDQNKKNLTDVISKSDIIDKISKWFV